MDVGWTLFENILVFPEQSQTKKVYKIRPLIESEQLRKGFFWNHFNLPDCQQLADGRC